MKHVVCLSLSIVSLASCFSPDGNDTGVSDSGAASTSSASDTTMTASATMTATTTSTTGEPTTSDSTVGTMTASVTSDAVTTEVTATATATSSPATSDSMPGTTDVMTGITTDTESCGNNVQDPGEACDDGNKLDTDACTSTCHAAGCGDGFVWDKQEECDGGDGCGPECKREFFRVFVTESETPPTLGGVAGADALCNSAALEAGLGGTYMAWISDTMATWPESRFVKSARPYRLLNGTTIADGWLNLVSGELLAPISVTETGAELLLMARCQCRVWTGTTKLGFAYGQACGDWTQMDIGMAVVGDCGASSEEWTAGCGGTACSGTARLYCFEQGLGA